jgi:hypothetical protein
MVPSMVSEGCLILGRGPVYPYCRSQLYHNFCSLNHHLKKDDMFVAATTIDQLSRSGVEFNSVE